MHSYVKDITGQKFGDCTALKYVGKKKWLIECRCGLQRVVAGADLRRCKVRNTFNCTHVLSERFWSKVVKTEECWTWSGAKHRDGYGSFRVINRTMLAHGFAWELENGPVPTGKELDHLCRNRACVRPAHLEPVTHIENVRRGNMPSVVAARGYLIKPNESEKK